MRKLFLLIALTMLFSTAFAQIRGFPDLISFNQMPVEVRFEVENQSSERLPVEVNFFLVGAKIVKPEFVEAKKSIEVKALLIPPANLVGETYKSRVLVRLGEKEEMKDVRYNFQKLDKCPVEVNVFKKEPKNGKLFFALKLENKAVVDVPVKFKKLSGLPQDWVIDVKEKEVSVPGLREGEILVDLVPAKSFKGNASALMECMGEELKAEIPINYTEPEKKLVGFIGLGNLFELVGLDLLLNLLLALVAAVLLIAFISRFVKRFPGLEEKK